MLDKFVDSYYSKHMLYKFVDSLGSKHARQVCELILQ